MVTSLAKFFRIGLSKGKNIIPLKDELNHAESYITIQHMRFRNFTFRIHTAQDIFSTSPLFCLFIRQQRQMNPYCCSYICFAYYGQTESSSEAIVNLQQGLEQAANDMDVEMSLVTLSEQNSAQEQKKLIEREIN